MGTSVPLRIDAELANQARSVATLCDRTLTAQIEHWAKLGRVLEAVLTGRSSAMVKEISRVDILDQVVDLSQTEEGRRRALAVICRHGNPLYEADPDTPGLLIERHPDGSTRKGRFVNRRFVPLP